MKPSLGASLVAIVIATFHAGPALAQSEAPAAATSAQVPIGEPEIVVTARRRAERLQDVPVAVTAVSGDSLRAANIVQVQDIQQKVPGLTIQPWPSTSPTSFKTVRKASTQACSTWIRCRSSRGRRERFSGATPPAAP